MSFGHLVEQAESSRRARIMHARFAKRVAAALGKGDFIPNRPGSLSLGYDLWARHENGDVILHCGGNAGWFDWFRPVQDGDTPDFTLTIAGRAYCLVRGVDVLPAGFVPVEHQGGPGRPPRRPSPEPSVPIEVRRPYVIEALVRDEWVASARHSELHLAQQDGNRYYRFNEVPFRVLHKDEVVYEWRPQPQGATV